MIETALQNQERALQEELNERLADVEISAEHRVKAIKFTDADKKIILKMIDTAAREQATRWDEDTQKKTFNQHYYDNAVPTTDEFDNFIWVCEQKALDPRANQIYFQKRQGRAVYMVAIDSYRLMAERAGNYRPGHKPTEYFDKDNRPYYGLVPHHCVTYCWKKDDVDGTWYEIVQIAFYEEYVQTVGKEPNRKANTMWAKMGRSQLEKCCESKMLRKGWPSELAGIYTREEMDQADNAGPSGSTEGGGGRGGYRDDLAAMNQGAKNRGHGDEGFDQRPPNERQQAQGKKQEAPKAAKAPKAQPDEMEKLCEICPDMNPSGKPHMRKMHDGVNAQGACMEPGCECTGFSDTPVAPECEQFQMNANAGTDKKERLVERMRVVGKCIEFTAPNPENKRQSCKVKIYGLPSDLKANPNDYFVCFHQHLFDALAMTPGEKITLLVDTKIDKGENKPQNQGMVWQYIEDVEQIGRRKFVDGKPVVEAEADTSEAQEQPAVAVQNETQESPKTAEPVQGLPGVFDKK